MGRQKVSKPPEDYDWLMREIEDMNSVLPPDERDGNYWKDNRRLIVDRNNLHRLIELLPKAVDSSVEIAHTVLDSLVVVITENGKLELVNTGLLRRIADAALPINRLRICPVCDSIYWPRTKRGKTCGTPKCINKAYEKTRPQRRKKEKR